MGKYEAGNWPPYNVKAITQNIRLVMRTGDIRKLSKQTYKLITMDMGFIAHYSLAEFGDEYQGRIEEFRKFLQCSEYLSRDYNYNWLHANRLENDSDFVQWYGTAYCKSKADAVRAIITAARTRWCSGCGKEVDTQFGEPLPDGLCQECQAKKVAAQPVCPKCGAKLDHLDCMVTERILYSYGGPGEFDERDRIEMDIDYWKCPHCYQQLDLEPSTEVADSFLSGNGQLALKV